MLSHFSTKRMIVHSVRSTLLRNALQMLCRHENRKIRKPDILENLRCRRQNFKVCIFCICTAKNFINLVRERHIALKHGYFIVFLELIFFLCLLFFTFGLKVVFCNVIRDILGIARSGKKFFRIFSHCI